MPTTHALVVVVAGGPGEVALPERLPELAMVIAADSGLDRARALGLAVDLVVGDFDSVTAGALAEAEEKGVPLDRHRREKDATDLELALRSVGPAYRRVLVIGGDRGRFDHTVGNALLLASPAFAHLEIEARFGSAHLYVIRQRAELIGRPGDLVSLFAAHGPARDVTTEGLRYALYGGELLPGSSLGVSNEFVGERATVSVGEGVVVAIQP